MASYGTLTTSSVSVAAVGYTLGGLNLVLGALVAVAVAAVVLRVAWRRGKGVGAR